jgi:hypothetical protein
MKRLWLVVTVLALVYALTVVLTQGGPLALVTLGTRFSDGDPLLDEGTEGYDGQFVYYIARDPADAARFLDVPAYRFQRILLPALGRLLALGQVDVLPWVLLAVNLAALAGGTWALEQLLAQHSASKWYALGYGLALGTLGAVRLTLPEPLAYGLALGGLLLMTRGRWLWAALLFALAALAKETTLILAAAVGLYLLSNRRWREAVVFGIVALLPFAAWQVILAQRLGAAGVGAGGAMATSFEPIPFAGVVRILTEGGATVFLVLGAILLPFVLLPTLWGLWAAMGRLRRGDVSLNVWLLLVNAAVMLFIPFSTYREPLGILRFIVGLQIAVILFAAQRRERRALRYSTLWALTLLILIASDMGGGVG